MQPAQFTVVKQASMGDDEIVWITDDDVPGCRSITNDAERVCKVFSRSRIIYRDTDGNWDEIVHKGGAFLGFRAARHMVPW